MTPSAPEQPAVMDYGLLQMAGSETPATQNLLVRGRGEFLFSKVVDTVRGGYFYPQDFLQNALLDLEACTDISLVLVPAYGADEALRVDLLVFTDPIVCSVLGLEETELAATIKRRISGQLGTEYLPERIEFFGLFPRRDAEGGVDHRWCKKQYLTGALHRSARQEIYQRVSELRRRCQP